MLQSLSTHSCSQALIKQCHVLKAAGVISTPHLSGADDVSGQWDPLEPLPPAKPCRAVIACCWAAIVARAWAMAPFVPVVAVAAGDLRCLVAGREGLRGVGIATEPVITAPCRVSEEEGNPASSFDL